MKPSNPRSDVHTSVEGMIRVGSRSILAVAVVAIAVLSWSGCATTSQAQDEDGWTPAGSASECCPVPTGAVGSRNLAAPEECWLNTGTDLSVNGYRAKGKAWLHPATGEYCAEEGAAIRFPDGPWIEGPSTGNYYVTPELTTRQFAVD